MSQSSVPGSYQPYEPPPPPPPAPPSAPPPAPKKVPPLAIVGIAVGAVMLLCCGLGAIALLSANIDKADVPLAAASAAPSTLPTTASPVPAEPAVAPSTQQPTPAEATFDLKPGSTLTVETFTGTIEVTVKSFRTSKTACDRYGVKPDEGMYLIADVTVKITEGTGSINPLFFNWVGDDGTTANAISGAFSGCGKSLDSGNGMRTGTLRSGQVVFDVSSTRGALEYEVAGRAVGSWRP